MSKPEKVYFDRSSYERVLELYELGQKGHSYPYALPRYKPVTHDFYGTKEEIMAYREQQRQCDEKAGVWREESAKYSRIARELFVPGGGIASMGSWDSWIPEVTLHRNHPQREELEAQILAIDPRAIFRYTEN
ncbi:hypothetical protein QKT49_gp167 [Acanthamoeba castellanii medusavirus]|uniref:Uncharacterized protein n=1 Tax=Acanthamoeba castellanii medusavirus J1 TaxID=3114988 RepID=A0A3T1CXN7_9VIRU|nr:hypothetical protein QKT49_gp167 [Acanthamoeba castellanii medusavirus]BBI30596.1 hypothetical protein [Acanthamoeba castellanii medusavirus J1]